MNAVLKPADHKDYVIADLALAAWGRKAARHGQASRASYPRTSAAALRVRCPRQQHPRNQPAAVRAIVKADRIARSNSEHRNIIACAADAAQHFDA